MLTITDREGNVQTTLPAADAMEFLSDIALDAIRIDGNNIYDGLDLIGRIY